MTIQARGRRLFVDNAVFDAANSLVASQLAVLTQIEEINIERVNRIAAHRQGRHKGSPGRVGRLKLNLRFIRQLCDLV